MLPETVRVKLSSEQAGAISLTQVVVRDMPVRELVEHMLGYTGKDEARVRGLLLRGTLVSGASRFRWAGWEPAAGEVTALLATFPDPEPGRPFDAGRCVRAVLRGGRVAIAIPREAGLRKGLLRRTAFWEVLMREVAGAEPRYQDYSYKERADVYGVEFSAEAAARVSTAAGMIVYSTLREQVGAGEFTTGEVFVER